MDTEQSQTQAVINISGKVLSEESIRVLSKGLSFAPTHPGKEFDTKIDLFRFYRNLHLKTWYKQQTPTSTSSTDTGVRSGPWGCLVEFQTPSHCVCDIAGRVARHVNNGTQQRFVQPRDGRVCEPTEANISLASAGKLRVHPDWVNNIKMKARLNSEPSTMDCFIQPHPETGTSDRFSFYDRFHQKNQKQPEEKLRSLKIIPELASLINTSEAEQVNRELSSSWYSLCQMRDTHYMFSLRLYFHLHNTRKNSAFLKEMQKRTEENIYLGLQGKLMCGQKETNTRPTEEQGRDPHGPAKFDRLPEEGKKFSVAMFPIEQMHKETISKLYAVKRKEDDVIARICQQCLG
ncbi:unnamed protein product [Leuciscus chuanchicus]